DTGELHGKRLTPRRLDTIFQTNLQSSYMAGRYKQQMATVEERPYWERVGIMDNRIRPSHAALNGFIARYDDPIWQTIYPPDGYRCRCRVRTRSAEDVERLGLMVQSSEGRLVDVEQEYGVPGETRTVTGFKNPKDGQVYTPDP
ncbi:phage head morphogenesis protein, partial [Providencia vermicola]